MSSIKIGRAQNAEVRITDSSVSRHHSNLILLDDGSIRLTDNFSKFGTLKLVRQPLKVVCNKSKAKEPIYLQIGRSMLTVTATPRYTFWQNLNCCFAQSRKRRSQVENFLHYEESPE